jgi:hypothetical protein
MTHTKDFEDTRPPSLTDSNFTRLDFDLNAVPSPERRKTDINMRLVREIFTEVKGMRRELGTHIEDEKCIIATAFPDSDADGHRRAHEAWIKKTEASTKFWDDLRASIAKWGAIGLLSFIAIAVWRSVLEGPK